MNRDTGHVRMQAKMGGNQLQDKGYRGLLGATRNLKEAGKDSSLELSEEEWPCVIQTSTLQNCERNICIVLSNLFSDMP